MPKYKMKKLEKDDSTYNHEELRKSIEEPGYETFFKPKGGNSNAIDPIILKEHKPLWPKIKNLKFKKNKKIAPNEA